MSVSWLCGELVRKSGYFLPQFSRQADGMPYLPGLRRATNSLVGPARAGGALRTWDPVPGLVVGSYQGSSGAVHARPHASGRRRRARAQWRVATDGGARSEHE